MGYEKRRVRVLPWHDSSHLRVPIFPRSAVIQPAGVCLARSSGRLVQP